MNSAWSQEIVRLSLVLLSAIIVGLSSGAWFISFTVHLLSYIIWSLIQVRIFQTWISRGANKSEAPDNTGIWQEMVKQVYRLQSSHKSRKKQLADLANYYHAVMRALPDATVVINKNMEIEWANKASNKLLGVKPTKDVGRRLDNIIRLTEFDVLFDPEAKVNRIEVTSPTSPGVTLSIVKQEYDQGNYLIIAQDISNRVATQKLRKAFIANASHELRTPLTVISGYLEILIDDEELPSPLVSVIQNAFEQASRMDSILEKLLVLSKLEEKQYDKSAGDEVDVKSLLEQMVADFRVSYAETKHEFEVIAEDIHLWVIEEEFYSVCQNLVSNAVKYSPPESTISICWLKNKEGYACLSVTDEGDGIPAEHLNRITERFYRAHQSNRQVSGTGLGLSIVKHILDNFGGYLDIESQVDKGSTFKACFPSYRIVTKKRKKNK